MTGRETGSAPAEGSALLAQCLEKDPEAWSRFCEQFCPVIYAAVQRVVGARPRRPAGTDIDDLVQEVFVRLLRDDMRLLRSYDPRRASLVTWLTVIARSVTLDSLKKKRVLTVPLEEDRHGREPPPPPTDKSRLTPERHAELLSPRQQLVLHMLFDKGMPVVEVSQVLGIREQTVRSYKHKAIRKLRDFYESGGDV